MTGVYIDSENILRGPPFPIELPQCSLGQFCFKSLNEQPKDRQLMVEVETGRKCTSGEFLDMSKRCSVGLRKVGLQEGSIVCLIGVNGVDINVAALGTLLIGGIVAPVDSTMKPFEYQHMLNLIDPALVICDSDVKKIIEDSLEEVGLNCGIITIGGSYEEINDDQTLRNLIKNGSPEEFQLASCNDPKNDIAFIVSSSGSTGLPKGVALTHHNLLFEIFLGRGFNEKFGDRIFIQTSHFFWVSSVTMFLISMGIGMRRVIIQEVTTENVLKGIDEHKPFWCLMAPSLVASLVSHAKFNNFDTSSLQVIVTAGSPLPKPVAEKVLEVWSSKLIIGQVYGMSELSGGFTLLAVGADIGSVGTLYPGTSVKIVDPETNEILPSNTEGELCCQSLGLMKGYIKNEEATKETIDENGWLHTGDIGYFTEKGLIYVTGRIKELMKLDNHQIAPAEIEHVIRRVPGVIDVAVAGIKISADSSHPMALVVKEEGSTLSEEEIIKCVNENLSEFKQLRAGICFVDFIPRTRTGKIKRKETQQLADDLYLGDSPYIL